MFKYLIFSFRIVNSFEIVVRLNYFAEFLRKKKNHAEKKFNC